MLVATYGTLRKNGIYHYYVEKSKFLNSSIISGFKMYNYQNWFPFVTKSELIDNILVEVYNVDENQYNSTKRMEISAGYEEIEIDIDGIKAKMFIISKENDRFKFDEKNLVKSGDWIKFISQQNKGEN